MNGDEIHVITWTHGEPLGPGDIIVVHRADGTSTESWYVQTVCGQDKYVLGLFNGIVHRLSSKPSRNDFVLRVLEGLGLGRISRDEAKQRIEDFDRDPSSQERLV